SVTGDGVDNTDPDNPVISFPDPSDIGAVASVNSAVALTDAGTIDITGPRHTLTTADSRTFTISYLGDKIDMIITLNSTSETFTFPSSALCVREGVASGDNILVLDGISGDEFFVSIERFGTDFYVVSKNMRSEGAHV